jgi:hypothetical protein
MSSLGPEILTWTGLLAQWVRFAQASLALPEDSDGFGARWRASVAAIINLQAVTFALADLERLAANERLLALDKAELLIDQSTGEIERIWAGIELSPALREVCADARLALIAGQAARGRSSRPSAGN